MEQPTCSFAVRLALALCFFLPPAYSLPPGAADAEAPMSLARSVEIANYFYDQGDYATALAHADRGLTLNAMYPPLWLVKTKSLLGLKRYSEGYESGMVALTADPGNIETVGALLRILLDWEQLSDAERQAGIADLVGRVDSSRFGKMLTVDFLSRFDAIEELELIMPAWEEAASDASLSRRMLALYLRQDFSEAARQLIDGGPDGNEPYAELCFLFGRLLLAGGDYDMSVVLMERAKANGFDQARSDFHLGRIYAETGNPKAAADAVESSWRLSEDPVAAVGFVVRNRLLSGGGTQALSLLTEALEAFPGHPALEARRALCLWSLGAAEEIERHETRLSLADNLPALYYGRALIHIAEGDYDAANKLFGEIRLIVNRSHPDPLDLLSLQDWLESRHRIFGQNKGVYNRRIVPFGRGLWNRERYQDAIVVWDQALSEGMAGSKRFALATSASMAIDGKTTEALLFLRRHLPMFGPDDLIDNLLGNNNWDAAIAILERLKETGADTPWRAILRVIAGLSGGNLESLDEDFATLVAMPTPSDSSAVLTVNADDLVEAKTANQAGYGRLVAEAIGLIVKNGRLALFPKLIGSPQMTAFISPDASGLISRVGLELIRVRSYDEARMFMEAITEGSPGNPAASIVFATLEMRVGRLDLAAGHIEEGLKTAQGFERAYLSSLQARMNGDRDAALDHLLECVALAPNDHQLRLEVVTRLVAGHRYTDARNLAEHFEILHSRGDPDIDYHVALSRGELGQYEQAVSVWRVLARRYPKSIPPAAGLGTVLNRMGKPDQTIEFLLPQTDKHADPQIVALLAEASLDLGNGTEALRWAEAGLETAPDDLRLLSIAVNAGELLEDYAAVEEHARKSLAIDPSQASMHTSYGLSLAFQKKWDLLYEHNLRLLDGNPRNLGALERESERYKALEDGEGAWKVDMLLAADFANDPTQFLRAAISAAGVGNFRYALPTLEYMVGLGKNKPVATLYFPRVSSEGFPGATSIERMREQLDCVEIMHAFAGLESLNERDNRTLSVLESVPAILLIGRSTPASLLALDKLLEEKEARAVLAIGEESLVEGTPVWADVDTVRRLAETGRWEFILSDFAPARLPAAEDRFTAFWTQARWLGNRFESSGEMRVRLEAELSRLNAKAQAAGVSISGWLHPSWGDYGQRVVSVRQDEVTTYRESVAAAFPLAFTITPAGFALPCRDQMRIPARNVPPGLSPADLATTLANQHPTRRAVLELGKVTSWQAQFARADDLFDEARCLALDMEEISYFQGRNSYFQGDVPVANNRALEARAYDPERSRTDIFMREARRLKRPFLSLEPRYWTDSNDEEFRSLEGHFSFHVTNKLELRLHAGAHRWKDDLGRLTGYSAGLGARYYFRREDYLQLDLHGVKVKDNGTYLEADAVWHGYYSFDRFKANGTFNLEYHREGIETRKAQEKKIRANRFVAESSTRLGNFWDLDANLYYINRTDSNDSIGGYLRPLYRVMDIPQFRVGYWFAAADSDRNPDEYYAPVDYQAHQLVATYRQSLTECFSITGLASWGYARTRGNDWREVFRFNAGFDWDITECVSLGGNYQYLKLPDYTLRQYGLALGIRF